MFCKNRVALIGLIGNDAQSRIATCVVWARLGERAVPLKKGVCVEVGENSGIASFCQPTPPSKCVQPRFTSPPSSDWTGWKHLIVDDTAPAEPADNENVTF